VTPVAPIAGQNFPRNFKGYLGFIAVFHILNVFTTQILAEPSLEHIVFEACLGQIRNQWRAVVNEVNK
jgi:hypothetical protein